MSKVDVQQETEQRSQGIAGGLVIGLPGAVDAAQLRAAASRWGNSESALPVAIVHPALPGMGDGAATSEDTDGSGVVRLLAREIPSGTVSPLPWLVQPAAYAALLAEAQALGAGACAILNTDMAALTPEAVEALVRPVLSGECDVAMPLYPAGRFDGLLNQAILAPVTRALYGKRVRYPLAQDFAVSASFLPVLRQSISTPAAGTGLVWPATEAIRREKKVCQVYLPVHHAYTAAGLDLPALLQQVVGPLFADVERYASVWQRVRGSQSTMWSGAETFAANAALEASPDPQPMVEAFQLAQRNLHEVWSLVLPPVTLLELKKLSRQTMQSFRMADALWARVVYDFALAYRLRTLSRGHLLGALAPLYLGWVGSRVLESDEAGPLESSQKQEARQEQLERAFEENKPYLVQRWRWPDRFNP